MKPVQLSQFHPPPLNTGDLLTRMEFERRYNAHPEIKKAELIEGVVYMPSPVHHQKHGKPHIYISTWIGTYVAATLVIDPSDNATVRLDFENEVQPDILLRLEPEQGGHSRISEDDYIEGPPELVVEISASSVSYDLHTKRRVYARSGVQEYIAIQMYEKRIDWFVLREGVYEALAPDENGILRSEVFPGLWLDSVAFWADDLQKILAVLQDGLASESHADFANRLHEQ
ncbi:MAG: Uma2 family endonuclease [Chloroflexota bacterium]